MIPAAALCAELDRNARRIAPLCPPAKFTSASLCRHPVAHLLPLSDIDGHLCLCCGVWLCDRIGRRSWHQGLQAAWRRWSLDPAIRHWLIMLAARSEITDAGARRSLEPYESLPISREELTAARADLARLSVAAFERAHASATRANPPEVAQAAE